MNITITGASGFIGQHLVRTLNAKCHRTTAISRQKSAAQQCHEIVMSLDELSPGNFPQTDVFIHLAGLAHSNGNLDEELYNHVNAVLPEKLAQLAISQNVKQFIFLSTSKVHGDETTSPFVSKSIIDPKDLYSRTKAEAEKRLKQLPNKSMNIVSIRPPVVYGKEPKANIAALLSACKNNKLLPLPTTKNRRSFLYVGNLCEAISTVIDNPYTGYQGYVLDDGAPVSTEELVLTISNIVSSKPRIVHLPVTAMKFADKLFSRTIGRAALKPLYSDFELDSTDFYKRYNWSTPYDLRAGIGLSFGDSQ